MGNTSKVSKLSEDVSTLNGQLSLRLSVSQDVITDAIQQLRGEFRGEIETIREHRASYAGGSSPASSSGVTLRNKEGEPGVKKSSVKIKSLLTFF